MFRPQAFGATVLATVLCVAQSPDLVLAQDAGGTEATSVATSVVASLSPGQRVRLLAPGISIADGLVVSASTELLSVLEESQEWEVTPALVERLSVRESATARTAIYGAAFGAAFGFVMGFFYDKLACEDGGCGSGVIVSSGLVGTVVGAGGGALLGRAQISWRQRFP